MKTVFRTDEVAHIWARQSQRTGRNHGNLYFEGRDIFSYGSHFCIARMHAIGKVFFTDRTYSPSTSKHIGNVRYAVNHCDLIYVPYPNAKLWEGTGRGYDTNGANWAKQLEEHYNKVTGKYFKAATREGNKLAALRVIQNIETYCSLTSQRLEKKVMETYSRKVDVRNDRERKRLLNLIAFFKGSMTKEELQASYERARKAEDRARAQREAKAAKENAERIAKAKIEVIKWQSVQPCDTRNFDLLDRVYLRVLPLDHSASMDTETVETSKGVTVSLKAARALFLMLVAGHDIKGHDIDGYTVIGINGTLRIGCHEIERSEINQLAALAGWSERIAEH